MHRTQIYFDEDLFQAIRQKASSMNISVSAYIRNTLKKELDAQKKQQHPLDFSDFSGMWQDTELTQEDIRSRAWR